MRPSAAPSAANAGRSARGKRQYRAAQSTTIVAPRAASIATKPQPIRGKTPNSATVSACATSQTTIATPSASPRRRSQRFKRASAWAPDRVEAALQDIGGGDAVDDFGTAFSGQIGGDHLAGHRRGRQPLIPERRW